MSEHDGWYLGVDPGSAKTGFAWVASTGTINKQKVLPTATLAAVLPEILAEQPAVVIMGNGTNSASIKKLLLAACADVQIITIEESYSTEDARKLYWQENPPRGWRRLLPLGLQVPPINLDGYAAAVLVQRYLKQK